MYKRAIVPLLQWGETVSPLLCIHFYVVLSFSRWCYRPDWRSSICKVLCCKSYLCPEPEIVRWGTDEKKILYPGSHYIR